MKRKRKTRQSPQLVEIYENLEKVYARKGPNSLWPNQPFQHKFKPGAKVLGVAKGGSVELRKGDIVIRSRNNKRLWKFFKYE